MTSVNRDARLIFARPIVYHRDRPPFVRIFIYPIPIPTKWLLGLGWRRMSQQYMHRLRKSARAREFETAGELTAIRFPTVDGVTIWELYPDATRPRGFGMRAVDVLEPVQEPTPEMPPLKIKGHRRNFLRLYEARRRKSMLLKLHLPAEPEEPTR